MLSCIIMTTFGTSFGSSLGSGSAASGNFNPNKDLELSQPPSESISSLHFSPVANYLVATSWDSQVRCYEVQANGQSVGKAATSHEQPVLCSAWSPDGSAVFTGVPHRSLTHDPHWHTPFSLRPLSICLSKAVVYNRPSLHGFWQSLRQGISVSGPKQCSTSFDMMT